MRTIIPKDMVLVPEHAKRVFKGVIYDVYQWDEKMFDGTTEVFEMLKRADTVEALVIHENKILVQYQEQPHLGHFISFPGGRHDHEGDTELTAVQRELREESGIVCREWKLIEATQPHGKTEQALYTFVAQNIIEEVPCNLDAGEKIENKWLTLEEFRELQKKTKFRSQSKKFLKDISRIDDLLDIPKYQA